MDWDNAHKELDDHVEVLSAAFEEDNGKPMDSGDRALQALGVLFGHVLIDMAHSLDVIAGEATDANEIRKGLR